MYRMKFWFEHGGGCLWSVNDAAKARYGYKVNIQTLPIDDSLKHDMVSLELRFRTYLDWDDPTAGCQWTAMEKEVFQRDARTVYERLCAQLGGTYCVENALESFM